MVVSVLSLAAVYTSDYPPLSSYWSRYVCDGTWTAVRIDRTTLQILAALDWRIHRFSASRALEEAMLELTAPAVVEDWTESLVDYGTPRKSGKSESENISDLKVIIDGAPACWMNGQLTPDGTPPPSSSFEKSVRDTCLSLID